MGPYKILRAANTSLNKKQLKTIFSGYDLGEVCGFRPASKERESASYYISTSTQKKKFRDTQAFPDTREYVLTLLDQNSPLDPALKPLLASCADAGLPVPRLIPNKAGVIQGSFKNQIVFVYSRMCGRHVFNPTIAQCASIGRFLARFHMASSCQQLEMKPINADWMEQQSLKMQVHIPPADAHLLKDGVDGIRSMLCRTDVQNLPRGVIHGALFRSNVLFNERGLSGALGFNQSGYGFRLFDLAVTINEWCAGNNGESNNAKTLALLGAYQRIRGLAKEEFWYFPLFMSFAAVSMWLRHLNDALCPQSAAMNALEQSRRFRKIVALHASRPFHLDERLLHKR